MLSAGKAVAKAPPSSSIEGRSSGPRSSGARLIPQEEHIADDQRREEGEPKAITRGVPKRSTIGPILVDRIATSAPAGRKASAVCIAL